MSEDLRSADFAVNSILSDPIKMEALKTAPEQVLRTAASEAKEQVSALQTDRWVYRLVVIFLGVVATTVVCGSIAFALLKGADLPSGLVALGSAAVGALAGLLAPSPGRQ
jgi:hypothetical protein